MNCEQSENLILESMDLVLDAERQTALSAHLAGCVECSGFLVGQQALDQQFSRSLGSIAPSAALRQKVLEFIDSGATPFVDKAARLAEAEVVYREQQVALKRAFLVRPQLWMKAAFKGLHTGVLALTIGLLFWAAIISGLPALLALNPEFTMASVSVVLSVTILSALMRYSPLSVFLKRM